MRHSIGKLQNQTYLTVGAVLVDFNGKLSIETDDPRLKNYLEVAIERGIRKTIGVEGINEAGNRVYAEIDTESNPKDIGFLGALQRNLPPGYLVLELLNKNDQQRKTA
jgi:hypothetical protein